MSVHRDWALGWIILDYSIPSFHEADFPLSLNPRIFQGTFRGGQDVRRALRVFALLSCLPSFLLPPVVLTSLRLWRSAPWVHASRLWMGCLRSGLNDLKATLSLIAHLTVDKSPDLSECQYRRSKIRMTILKHRIVAKIDQLEIRFCDSMVNPKYPFII